MVKINSSSVAACTISFALLLGLCFSYYFFFFEDTKFHKCSKSNFNHIPSLYSVHILTWNVARNDPSFSEDYLPLLGINETFKPDFIVVGIQESVEVNLFKKSQWPVVIQESLKDYDYSLIGVVSNSAMDLIVYVKKLYASEIDQFEYVEKATNSFSFIAGHKGGISIRFNLNLNTIAFTNSHLSSGADKLIEREREFSKISDKKFKYCGYPTDHDYYFWFGDLNYRLKFSNPIEVNTIIKKINSDLTNSQSEIDFLLLKDQLKWSQIEGRSFSDYEEQKITFPPTYKFIKGLDNYNLERVPSYCDRILMRKLDNVNRGIEVIPMSYQAHMKYSSSDHKPVTADYYIRA